MSLSPTPESAKPKIFITISAARTTGKVPMRARRERGGREASSGKERGADWGAAAAVEADKARKAGLNRASKEDLQTGVLVCSGMLDSIASRLPHRAITGIPCRKDCRSPAIAGIRSTEGADAESWRIRVTSNRSESCLTVEKCSGLSVHFPALSAGAIQVASEMSQKLAHRSSPACSKIVLSAICGCVSCDLESGAV